MNLEQNSHDETHRRRLTLDLWRQPATRRRARTHSDHRRMMLSVITHCTTLQCDISRVIINARHNGVNLTLR